MHSGRKIGQGFASTRRKGGGGQRRIRKGCSVGWVGYALAEERSGEEAVEMKDRET